MQAHGKFCVITPHPTKTHTASGLIIPDSVTQATPHTGTVSSVGSEVRDIQPGMNVCWGTHGWVPYKDQNQKDWIFITEENILMILEEEDTHAED